jgi:hypothetical protein
LGFLQLSIDTSLGDYKEGYYIGVEVPSDDPQSERPFFGPNQWPSEGKLSLFLCFPLLKSKTPLLKLNDLLITRHHV